MRLLFFALIVFLSTLQIEFNMAGGQYLKLSDGTTWEVAPQDIATVASWLLPYHVTITPQQEGAYPYLLTVKETGVSIYVRPIENAQ